MKRLFPDQESRAAFVLLAAAALTLLTAAAASVVTCQVQPLCLQVCLFCERRLHCKHSPGGPSWAHSQDFFRQVHASPWQGSLETSGSGRCRHGAG